jgi:signal recognition particle GTPase
MSEEENNVIDFMSKSKMRRIAAETGHNPEDISDEDFQVFLQALFGPYKGGAYLPE